MRQTETEISNIAISIPLYAQQAEAEHERGNGKEE